MTELKTDVNFSLVIDGMGRKLLQHATTASVCVYGRRVLESASASSLMGSSNASPEVSPGAHTSDHTFDSSSIIILSALLGSLLCALALSALVRCSLRCRGQIALESSDEMAIPVAHMGPKSKVMEALPTLFYKTGSKPLGVDSDCPIYLADFVEGERVRVLPKCNHYFHVDCIDTWLVSNSSCSTCRHYLLDDMDSLRCTAHRCDSRFSVTNKNDSSHVVVMQQPSCSESIHVVQSRESYGRVTEGPHMRFF